MLAVGFEWVWIEEALAIDGNAGEQPIIKRSLHNIHVASITVKQEKAQVPKIIGDSRARFTIGAHIGQLVVTTEGLPCAGRADATSEIELFADHVVPNRIDCVEVTFVTGE